VYRSVRHVAAIRDIAHSKADGDAARRVVLDAAERVFAARGYAGATTRAMAAEAGIGKRMLFYYFPTKEAVYRAVLERVVEGLIAVHEQFRNDPGPIGLAEAVEGITHFAAANLSAVKILVREIMDGGPHLAWLVREHLAPLFARGEAEVTRNMVAGAFRGGDARDVIINVGGLTLYYFLMLPLLELVWTREPLAPGTLAERVAAVQQLLLHGLAGAS